jgi:N-acetylmuramoyl-L-alanine amidase
MSQLNISHNFKSENFDLRKEKVSLIIIHYTETKNLKKAIELLTEDKRKVSCHYVIDLDGMIYNLVHISKRAWHAGVSKWKNLEDINSRSIGIEIVYQGEHNQSNYPETQIDSLLKLLEYLKKNFEIPFQNILGHSDIAPLRKIDPGIYFPWRKLSENSFGLWTEDRFEDKKLNNNEYKSLLENLINIGYPYICLKNFGKNNKIIDAFHRHHIPRMIGKFPTQTSLNKTNDLLKI